MTRTQNEQLLELLKTRPVTPLDALREIGSFRLSARVYDLRHQVITAHKNRIKSNSLEVI